MELRTEKIKMVDLGAQYSRIKEEIDLAIHEVIDSERFIGGPEVESFEHNLANYLGVKNVIPCGNGTDALTIAFIALGFKPGEEIIMPSFTFVATVEAAALLGLKPVFADIDPDYFTLDPEDVKNKITSKTVAIVPVHLYGQNAAMEQLMKIAKENNLRIVEDAAQSIMAQYTFQNGIRKYSGTMGDVGITSFFPSKNLGAFGDGGALFVNDDSLSMECREIANHGQKIKYTSKRIGLNSRLDPLQAAILNVKLRYLDEFTAHRQRAASTYDGLLQDIPGVIIPGRNSNSDHVFHQYTIRVDGQKRDGLKDHLEDRSIPSMIYYPYPLHTQPAYYDKSVELPHSVESSKSVLSLPMHSEITGDQQEYICEEISKFMFSG